MKRRVISTIFLTVAIFLSSLYIMSVTSIQAFSTSDTDLRQLGTNENTEFVKITSDLKKDLRSIDNNAILDIIIETTTQNYGAIRHYIESCGGSVAIEYENANALAVSATSEEIIEIAKNDEIKTMYKDKNVELPTVQNPKENNLVNPQLVDFELLSDNVVPVNVYDYDISPLTHGNALLTNAYAIWEETDFGAGTVVAVIDTGVYESVFFEGNVIGGIDLSDDVGTSYEGFNASTNHYHGTAVSSQIASHVEIIFPEGSLIAESFYEHNPLCFRDENGDVHVLNIGTAPLASIYGVKVFDHTGSVSSTSIIMNGIDHAISLDVDVISLSIGGWTPIPGEDPMDLLLDAASEAGIAVVTSAGNEGPSPLEIGSPASSISGISVGAATDPIHERVYGSYSYGDPSQGYFYYPSDDIGIIYFSSRGPTADGRLKPDLVATGYHNWGPILDNGVEYLGWFSGTSFSTPVVSGGAALLANYINSHPLLSYLPPKLKTMLIKTLLIEGSDPIDGYDDFEQGAGYINLNNSLNLILEWLNHNCRDNRDTNALKKNILHCFCPHGSHKVVNNLRRFVKPLKLKNGVTTLTNIIVEPQNFAYFAFEVSSETDSIQINVSGVNYADPEDQNPLLGDLGWFYLSTAIHGGSGSLYDMYPLFDDYQSEVFTDYSFQAGIIRLTIENDFYSFEPLVIDEITIEVREVKVKADCFKDGLKLKNSGAPIDRAYVGIYEGRILSTFGYIHDGEELTYEFEVPDNLYISLVELSWIKDFQYYGTSDLDFYIFDSDGNLVSYRASISSPENTYLYGSGNYTIVIVGYQINSRFGFGEFFKLSIYQFAYYYWVDTPLWLSDEFVLGTEGYDLEIPADIHGIAVAQHYQIYYGIYEIPWKLGYIEV